jgi:hypothetical protein
MDCTYELLFFPVALSLNIPLTFINNKINMNRNKITRRYSNNTKEIKMKIQCEELASNLKLTKSSYQNKSMSNSRQEEFGNTLCNYNSDKAQMKTVLKQMLDYKKTNKNISKEVIEKIKFASWKEKMILQLYEELNYHMKDNSVLTGSLERISNLKNECELNRNLISEYCEKLKSQFKSFVETIEMYEERIQILKKEREQLIRTNEAIIDMKSK